MTEEEQILALAHRIKLGNSTRSRPMMGHGDFRTEQVCEDAARLADLIEKRLAKEKK